MILTIFFIILNFYKTTFDFSVAFYDFFIEKRLMG